MTSFSTKDAPTDFFWSQEEEPHAARTRAMLAKYGKEINKLMGPEPKTKYIATCVVLTQLYMGLFVVKDLSWPVYLLVAYVIGGFCTHNLFLAVHEVTHNLAFKTAWMNDAFAMFVNIPLVLPYAMMFKTYHAEHHKYQGWDGVDADIAAFAEAKYLNSFLGKLFFLTFQIVFYALRPVFIRLIDIKFVHVLNYIVICSFHFTLAYFFGFSPMLYWLVSDFMACSLHPMAGHFLSEHYMFDPNSKQETFSYYGPLNVFGYNVGYHNEHHDFPNVAWSKLEALRRLAPEFYDHLQTVPSWPMTSVRFLFGSHMNEFCRMKRERGAGKRKTLIPTAPPGTWTPPSPSANKKEA
eukprot:CAMPEP_0176414070 /NCGR_PEP_ID=MMETSP0127-20121128/5051_1 /TAXON_ID=938130 /ORGANISM="Platyophrya macrostoma, Strain WH" /LENGTH=350 /DNA_ID=CAMNT_0017793923 /DNA_START=57 /DNA_END=1109 /DNA_ORIENTATION=-